MVNAMTFVGATPPVEMDEAPTNSPVLLALFHLAAMQIGCTHGRPHPRRIPAVASAFNLRRSEYAKNVKIVGPGTHS